MKGTTLDSTQLVLEGLVELRAEWRRHPEVIPARCIAELEALINAIPSPRETFGLSKPGPEQPADANVRLVQQKLGERAAAGLRKYGVTTERKDLTLIEWMVHLQEELMDAAVYVQAALNHVPVRTPASTSERERWNIERDGDALLVCFNDHSKSDGCRYQRFVPERDEAPGDAAAWLHQVVGDDGEPDQALSFSRDSFPLEGVAGYRSVSVRPLVYGDTAAQQQEPDLIFDQRYRARGLAYDDNTRRFARWWFSHGYLMAKDPVKEASRG